MLQAFEPNAMLAMLLALVGVFALGLAGWAYGLWRRRRLQRRDDIHACARCGYDLSGVPRNPICPECGHVRERLPPA